MIRCSSFAGCSFLLATALALAGTAGCASSAPDEGAGSAGQNIQSGAALRSPIAAGLYASADGSLLVRVSNTSIDASTLSLTPLGQAMTVGEPGFSDPFCQGVVDVALGGAVTVACQGASIPLKVSAVTKTSFTLQKGNEPAHTVSSTAEALAIETPPTATDGAVTATMTAIDADGIALDFALAGVPQPGLKVAWQALTSDLYSKQFAVGRCSFFATPRSLSSFGLVPIDSDCTP